MDLIDRVESAAELIDAVWCDGMSEDASEELSGHMAAVEGLDAASSDLPAVALCVSALLDCVDRCGSVVLQSLSILTSGSADADSRLAALEALRGLSEARQAEISDEEVSAFHCLQVLLGSLDVSSECQDCVTGCMALHTLGCRIGLSVCGTEIAELATRVCLSSLDALLSQGGGRQQVAAA